MKSYNEILPEVIAGLGLNTKYDQGSKLIKKLHIELEDWLGDDLMKCYPVYFVTENLKNGLENQKFKGFQFDEMEVTEGEYFEDNFQLNIALPKFYWMKIVGKENEDDLYISPNKSLMADISFINYVKQNFRTEFLYENLKEDKVREELLEKLLASAKNRDQI
ncbi:hypothetical protein [uncultured Cytophaga sp.]|uniref:hypothetical protein n=1 Tax=uncultured Cytophaga sp. TaxID=160238 RepID=UPI00262C4FC4|nr:hypothetical protein [uncultured Cytophaga sp.]